MKNGNFCVLGSKQALKIWCDRTSSTRGSLKRPLRLDATQESSVDYDFEATVAIKVNEWMSGKAAGTAALIRHVIGLNLPAPLKRLHGQI